MQSQYEYRFIRVGKGTREQDYQQVVKANARDGWRLVQILAPGAGGLWAAPNFIEVILERRVED